MLLFIIILFILIVLVLLIMNAEKWSNKILFIPDTNHPGPPPNGFNEVYIHKSIHGWIYEPYSDAPIILHCHGNAGNIRYQDDMIRLCGIYKVNLLLFDYRGYGMSIGGSPCASSIKSDAQVVYDWLVQDKSYAANNIIIYGTSMGGSAATHLAANNPCRCLILRSTFSCLQDVVEHQNWKMGWLIKLIIKHCKIDIELHKELRRVTVPVMILHSPDDEVIPHECCDINVRNCDEVEYVRRIKINGYHNDPVFSAGTDTRVIEAFKDFFNVQYKY